MEKFDAVVKYGMEKDPRITHDHFYTVVDNRTKDMDELYKLCGDIWKDNVPYASVKEKMKHIASNHHQPLHAKTKQ
jgi:hypothetical protein